MNPPLMDASPGASGSIAGGGSAGESDARQTPAMRRSRGRLTTFSDWVSFPHFGMEE
jgi:hypothetical protein